MATANLPPAQGVWRIDASRVSSRPPRTVLRRSHAILRTNHLKALPDRSAPGEIARQTDGLADAHVVGFHAVQELVDAHQWSELFPLGEELSDDRAAAVEQLGEVPGFRSKSLNRQTIARTGVASAF